VWAEVYLHSKSYLNPSSHLATTDVGGKLGAVPLWGGGAGSPSNTMWPGTRPTCKPSLILIDPTVWSQYTNVTDRQDRQTDRHVVTISAILSKVFEHCIATDLLLFWKR